MQCDMYQERPLNLATESLNKVKILKKHRVIAEKKIFK